MPRCPFCDKRNSASVTELSQCGAELSSPDSRTSSPVEGGAEVGPNFKPESAVPESELDPFEAEMAGLLKEGQKIEAIKRYRKKTGADLRSAKVAVEQFAARQGLSGSQSGCGTASAILLAVVVAVVVA
jgi:ribosomal protein L7/L12